MSIPNSSHTSRRAASAGVSSLFTFPPGNSHSPPSRPCSGLREMRSRGPLHTSAAPMSWWGSGARGLRCGRSSTVPRSSARQPIATGQSSHFGSRGVQTEPPRSINAWLSFPAEPPASSIRPRASPSRSPGVGLSRSYKRLSTRRTLPSTAGSGRPNAMLATAPAVYGPMPGRERSSATSSGNRPS